jgi:hypothetical protein
MAKKVSIKTIAKKATKAVTSAAQNVGKGVSTAAQSVGKGTTTAAKAVGKGVSTGAKASANAAKTVAKKTVTAVKTVQAKGQEAGAIALFAPFAPLARIFLTRRGVTPAKDLKALALQVHNEKGKRSFGLVGSDAFDYGYTTPDEIGEYERASGVLPELFGAVPPISPEIIISVIQFLKGIFDQIKAKKAAKQPLSKDEQAVADAAPQIEKALEDAKVTAQGIVDDANKEAAGIAKDGKDEITGGGFLNWKTGLVLVILVALFFWFRSKGAEV